MQNKIKVNLGCSLASQFASVVTNKRPLILGSLITHLVVYENWIDLDDNDLHIPYDMQPPNLHYLEVMGSNGKKEGVFYFYALEPIMTRPKRTLPQSKTNDMAQDSLNRPSTSAIPF